MATPDMTSRRRFLKLASIVCAAAARGAGVQAAAPCGRARWTARRRDDSRLLRPVSLPRRSPGALEVSATGLDCMYLVRSTQSFAIREDAVHLIRYACADGVTCFDTTEVHGQGLSGRYPGKTVRAVRNHAQIATGPAAPLNSGAGHVSKVEQESLKRLRADHIDLLCQLGAGPKGPHRGRGRLCGRPRP